jgi:type II secretory pathway predicted ATPase ExeA
VQRDPFPTTADPADYVPRAASEQALAELLRHVVESAAPVALTGPMGLGKTLLLKVLAARLAPRAQAVYLPYPALPPEGLCAWALRELGLAADANSEAALIAHARALAAQGRPLVVLLDEGAGLPIASARGLVDLCAETGGALRLVVAASDGVASGSVLAALGPAAREVRLRAAMSPAETAAYATRRLALAGVEPAARARFGARALARLHAASAGVPRRVNELAARLLRGDRRWDADEDGAAAPVRARFGDREDLLEF